MGNQHHSIREETTIGIAVVSLVPVEYLMSLRRILYKNRRTRRLQTRVQRVVWSVWVCEAGGRSMSSSSSAGRGGEEEKTEDGDASNPLPKEALLLGRTSYRRKATGNST